MARQIRSFPLGVSASLAIDGGAWRDGDAALMAPTNHDVESPVALAQCLTIDAVPEGAWVVLLDCGDGGGLLTRWLGRRAPAAPRSVRGAALLLRGCRAIGGGIDPASGLDLAWGRLERHGA